MKKAAIAAVIALMVAGCATVPVRQQHQVNRAKKADKYVMPKKSAPVPMPTPNQVVEKRWFPKFRIQWLHK